MSAAVIDAVVAQSEYHRGQVEAWKARYAIEHESHQQCRADVVALLGAIHDYQPLPGKAGDIEAEIRRRYER